MAINFSWDKIGCQVIEIAGDEDNTRFYLSDSTHFTVGISLNEFSNLLKVDLNTNPYLLNLEVFLPFFEMSDDQWMNISKALRSNTEVEEVFSGHPKLQNLLHLNFTQIRELPLLLYGARYHQGFFYLHYAVNFISP